MKKTILILSAVASIFLVACNNSQTETANAEANKKDSTSTNFKSPKADITVDEAMFLGGLEKGEFLREFEPDFFFDDQTGHVQSAADHVPAGHVESGVRNV